ncbi:hypothetical protein [Deferribacter autotrophicus]|uniref:hypothetical protein n=1 Tax=Deferribacter autotrophicus TaxID=500465 RepID=UPI00165EAA7C|nr:hypothetical protein [Deferribacter autotrophicus]
MDEKTKAEILRKKYLYKELLLKGKIKNISIENAKKLAGVDTAYHLYQNLNIKKSP